MPSPGPAADASCSGPPAYWPPWWAPSHQRWFLPPVWPKDILFRHLPTAGWKIIFYFWGHPKHKRPLVARGQISLSAQQWKINLSFYILISASFVCRPDPYRRVDMYGCIKDTGYACMTLDFQWRQSGDLNSQSECVCGRREGGWGVSPWEGRRGRRASVGEPTSPAGQPTRASYNKNMEHNKSEHLHIQHIWQAKQNRAGAVSNYGHGTSLTKLNQAMDEIWTL